MGEYRHQRFRIFGPHPFDPVIFGQRHARSQPGRIQFDGGPVIGHRHAIPPQRRGQFGQLNTESGLAGHLHTYLGHIIESLGITFRPNQRLPFDIDHRGSYPASDFCRIDQRQRFRGQARFQLQKGQQGHCFEVGRVPFQQHGKKAVGGLIIARNGQHPGIIVGIIAAGRIQFVSPPRIAQRGCRIVDHPGDTGQSVVRRRMFGYLADRRFIQPRRFSQRTEILSFDPFQIEQRSLLLPFPAAVLLRRRRRQARSQRQQAKKRI